MKFSPNQSAQSYLNRLIRQYELNLEASDFYNAFLIDCYDAIDKATIKDISRAYHLSVQNAYFTAMTAVLDLDPDDDELNKLITSNSIDSVTKLENSAYNSNPFVKNIRPNPRKIGGLSLEYNTYYPYEGFLYDSSYSKGDCFAEIARLGFFESPFEYLQLVKDDSVWMSITPYEINTMRHSISEAHGNVITFGLGLGYFAYMAARKDEVTKVTVVENDPAVIRIFEQSILPLTSLESKIEIIEADAYDFMERGMKNTHYDYAFVDIYRQATDALVPYLKIKRLSKEIESCQFEFWIEDEINLLLNRIAISYLADPASECDENDELKGVVDLFKQAVGSLDIELVTKEDIINFIGNRSYLPLLSNIPLH